MTEVADRNEIGGVDIDLDGAAEALLEGARQPEVGNDKVTVAADEDVFRLEVAMNDAALVESGNSLNLSGSKSGCIPERTVRNHLRFQPRKMWHEERATFHICTIRS